MVVCVVELLQI